LSLLMGLGERIGGIHRRSAFAFDRYEKYQTARRNARARGFYS
jgi:hypothetical protein